MHDRLKAANLFLQTIEFFRQKMSRVEAAADNELQSLFTGLPAGRRTDDARNYPSPYFTHQGYNALFWTSSASFISSWFFGLRSNDTNSDGVSFGKRERIQGLSVRCVRD